MIYRNPLRTEQYDLKHLNCKYNFFLDAYFFLLILNSSTLSFQINLVCLRLFYGSKNGSGLVKFPVKYVYFEIKTDVCSQALIRRGACCPLSLEGLGRPQWDQINSEFAFELFIYSITFTKYSLNSIFENNS